MNMYVVLIYTPPKINMSPQKRTTSKGNHILRKHWLNPTSFDFQIPRIPYLEVQDTVGNWLYVGL